MRFLATSTSKPYVTRCGQRAFGSWLMLARPPKQSTAQRQWVDLPRPWGSASSFSLVDTNLVAIRVSNNGYVATRAIKWLPNSMGIDPSHPLCRPYYERMAALGLLLLTHVGLERAVVSAHDQESGNPLRLRHALDAGVTVLAAQRRAFTANSSLIAIRNERLQNRIDLYLALGGDFDSIPK